MSTYTVTEWPDEGDFPIAEHDATPTKWCSIHDDEMPDPRGMACRWKTQWGDELEGDCQLEDPPQHFKMEVTV